MLKRVFDLIIATSVLIITLPLFLIIGLLVRLTMGRPVIFKQERIGYGEKVFVVYKFRTMLDEKNSKGELLPDAERLTRVGAFLRRTSLDELPQLWNVLRGDMSLVGPRPLFPRYLPYYTKRERRRHSVRPGIT